MNKLALLRARGERQRDCRATRRGRKSDYHAEIAETICNRLVNGESLRAICADPAMPARATVFRWLASNQEFRRSYALARECQAEDMVDEILVIADDSSRDYVKSTGVDGKVTWVVDREHLARCRLRISTRKRLLARMAPRKYGKCRQEVVRRPR
jgi:hypothetical protein